MARAIEPAPDMRDGPRAAHGPAADAGGPSAKGLPQAAAVLAYAGALPPIIAALLVIVRIAFFGGVRWGVAVMRPEGPSFGHLLGGVLPLLVALPFFYLQSETARFALILVSLPALLISDLAATRRGSGAPDWYLGVRTPLTLLMFAAFAAAFAQALIAA